MSERGEIQIDASVATKVTFASHQNAIPILQELKLANPTLEVLEKLELEIWSDPQFLQPKKWIIDRLSPNTTVNISDRDVALNASFLLQVHESLTGTVHIVLSKDGLKQSEAIKPVEILAKTEWGGASAMPELLAAFVTPNDPAVDEVLKAASKVLASAGKPDGINGYESGSRTRVWELVSAVWSAVAGYRLTYALPPASFETQGQKTRSPSAILASGLATCLDNALLFAAAFEQAGLNPIIVLTKGHAMVGVWLQPQEFNQLIVDDPGTVRKRVALKELVIFETTLVTQKPPPSFSVAVSEGDNQISPGKEGDFVLALDIRRARMQRLRPVALQISDSTTTENSDAEVVIAESLEAAPSLPAFDVAPEEIKPTSAAGRLDQWQRKLLDLTAGNRLLNVRPSATTLRIVCPDPARLEDKLADGAKIRIVAQPPLEGAGAGGRDADIHQVRTGERLLDEYARAALDRDEVLTTLDAKTLDASLVELYRKARLDLQEGGANTLFLALGFLNWKRPDTDAKTYRAPLILLPVTLERKSALSGVRMIAHEDEPRFNLTLLQMLHQDFELSIPELEGSLPADDSGVDVPNVWNIVRRAVRDIPGFEVVEEMVLGTFSFAKYLMWKDLVDRTDALKASDVVRHLIDTPREPFLCETLSPRPEDLDRIVDPAELFAPLPADSSQLAAVVASGKGCNFVLDGPPGTGKSQTIANIIAHNMALGRKVLFVAEKMAALDVVYRRLEERRLGAFCLELHSHKATKADVLAQLGRAWDTRDNVTAAQWREKAAELKYLRDTLNEIVELLHARHSNGLSLHEAVGRAIRDFDIRTPLLAWNATSKQSAEKLRAMREAARRLDVNFKAIEDLDPNAFGPITVDDWSNAWQSDIVAVTTQLARTLPTARQAFTSLIERLSLPIAPANREQLTTIDELARLLPTLVGLDVSVAFGNDGTRVVDYIDQAIQRLNAYRLAERSLSVPYPSESVRRIPVLVLQAKLAEADIALWPLSLLKRIAVRKELQRSAGLAAKPTLRNDLPALATMLAELRSLDELGAETSKLSAWRGLATDVPFLIRTREAVAALRSISARLATSPEILSTIRHRLGSVCVEGNELLGEAMPIAKAAATYHATFTALIADLDQFCNVAKCPAPFDGVDLLAATELLTDHVLARRASLKAWCDWRRARGLAVDLDLKVLVDALERAVFGAGEAEEQFEIAYAKWWAGVVIDAEPRLRSFVPIEHADRIAAFRKLDDQLSELTVQYIRAKIAGEIPARDEVKRDSGYGVLRHELTKRMRHKPVRQLASEIGSALTTLTPCLLMSPLSIAQYLPPGTEMFDLVIFDEASQITTWDAIGAIARGKQVIIAGDPKQMPPSNFWNRAANPSADNDADVEEDLESILDECLGASIPRHRLTWHYRSKHESLIAFSNHRYYDGELITFPAPVTRESAVFLRRVSGVYAKGKTRTNQIEAEAIVALAIERLLAPEFGGAGKSLAIVTLNSEQQRLIEDLLDRERQKAPALERFFAENCLEPVVVKNLDTVQGDERDIILLGIGYGPTSAGHTTMSMTCGPLTRSGGWRRLNVAITRAREELVLFTSFTPQMIDLNRTSATAVRDLRHFIEFAERGPRALVEAVAGSVGGFESPFEQAVARGLRERGWTVVSQIGVSRFRIDLGVVHPDRPGDYLVGVECDGASYHSAATARDRDKVRAGILQGLGWALVRIWSTDWWVDQAGALQRLDIQIRQCLEQDRLKDAARKEAKDSSARVPLPLLEAPDDLEDEAEYCPPTSAVFAKPPAPNSSRERTVAAQFRPVDLTGNPNLVAERFYDELYDPVLESLVDQVIAFEAPVRDEVLVNRIARAHGLQRSGRVVRERIIAIAKGRCSLIVEPGGAVFAWPSPEIAKSWNTFRLPVDDEGVRWMEDIALAEIRALGATVDANDPAVEIARRFGVRRLTGLARERIELALSSSISPES